tara:strand:- start:1959 stop:2903 length:945 start_codon:yes stop_codon:yes gene_type:complete
MINQIVNEYYSNSKYWKWNGYKIAWNLKGNKNDVPIILIHGFGACGAHWRSNINFFVSKGYSVYSIDLLGFGKSDQPGLRQIGRLDNGVWCDQVSDFIKEVIRPINSKKVILIGNSLGSLVALTCAVSIPYEISGVIASPLPDQFNLKTKFSGIGSYFRKIKIALLKIFFILLPIELILFLIVRLGFISLGLSSAYHKKNKVDRELIDIIKKPVMRNTAAGSLRAMCLGMSTRNYRLKAPYLLNIICKLEKIPLLLLWGEKDNFIPLFLGKRIANFYSWVELKIIPNSGHCVHDEDHKSFNEISYQWISDLKLF